MIFALCCQGTEEENTMVTRLNEEKQSFWSILTHFRQLFSRFALKSRYHKDQPTNVVLQRVAATHQDYGRKATTHRDNIRGSVSHPRDLWCPGEEQMNLA